MFSYLLSSLYLCFRLENARSWAEDSEGKFYDQLAACYCVFGYSRCIGANLIHGLVNRMVFETVGFAGEGVLVRLGVCG